MRPEEWRPVVGYEGLYEVSDLGRVKSVGIGRNRRPGRIMRAQISPYGYRLVGLSRRCYRVHRLVLIAFKGDYPDLQCNHIDGIKTNNRLTNLEWVTPSGNSRHAVAAGLTQTGDRHYSRTQPERLARGEQNGAYTHPERMPRGERHGCAKLTEADVREIRSSAQSGVELARKFGVSDGAISHIRTGRKWRNSV